MPDEYVLLQENIIYYLAALLDAQAMARAIEIVVHHANMATQDMLERVRWKPINDLN